MTHSTPTGTISQRRPAEQTALALFAILALLFSMMALLAAQPAQAVTTHAVLALSEDCEQTALHKQIDWSGNDTDVIGDMHSNAGITVSGARNDVSGAVTFDDTNCNFVLSGSNNTGGILTASNAGTVADPAYAQPTAEQCTFTFAGAGDTDLASVASVWLDDDTLKPGIYCKTGTGKLQQSKQGVDGIVSFFAHGHIDLSNGSNATYSPFRADAVLTHSLADSVDAVTLAGSGTDNSDRTQYNGIIYAPNGEAETGGQWITIGCIVAETVKLNGSDHIIGSNCGGTPPPPPAVSISKSNNTTGPVAPGTAVNYTLVLDVTNGPVAAMTIVDQLPPNISNATLVSDGGGYDAGTNRITWNLTNVADNETLTYTATVNASAPAGTHTNTATITVGPCVGAGCVDTSDVVVVVQGPTPTVTITKTNNATGPVATGTAVNFTLTFDVTNGPVPAMTVVDQLPAGIGNATAISNSGSYVAATNRITWNLVNVADNATLTYTATVNATAGTHTNTATITVGPCVGAGCVDTSTVTVPGGGALGGNPSPTPGTVPNTAMGLEIGGAPVTMPIVLVVLLLVGSLGAFAVANVRSRRNRQI